MMKTFLKRSGVLKGFTLIELLVVIAIIGILASIVLASLNTARQKSRDARRLADIKSTQLALELFFDSCGKYPEPFAAATLASSMNSTVCTVGATTQALSLYLATAPANPTPGGATYLYTAAAGGATYSLTFSLEGATGTMASGAHTASPSGIN